MTRAQEAEENYVIKRELAVVRQQCNAASENLERAQDTIRELQQQKVAGLHRIAPHRTASHRIAQHSRAQQSTAQHRARIPIASLTAEG